MKGWGAFFIVVGILLIVWGIYDNSVITMRNSWRAMMGSGSSESSDYTTVLILIGIGLIIGGGVMVGRKEVPKKTCPYCAEKIRIEAKVCRYCGKELPKIEDQWQSGWRIIEINTLDDIKDMEGQYVKLIVKNKNLQEKDIRDKVALNKAKGYLIIWDIKPDESSSK